MKEFYMFGRKITLSIEKEDDMKLPKGMYVSGYEERAPLPKGMYYPDEYCKVMRKRKREQRMNGSGSFIDTVVEDVPNKSKDIREDYQN